MKWLLRCSNQHYWEIPAPATENSTLPTCPVCNQSAFFVSASEEPKAGLPLTEVRPLDPNDPAVRTADTICNDPAGARSGELPPSHSFPDIPSVLTAPTLHDTLAPSQPVEQKAPPPTVPAVASPPIAGPHRPSALLLDQTLPGAPVLALQSREDRTERVALNDGSVTSVSPTVAHAPSTPVPPAPPSSPSLPDAGSETLMPDRIIPGTGAAPTRPSDRDRVEEAEPTEIRPIARPTQDADKTAFFTPSHPAPDLFAPPSVPVQPATPVEGHEILGVLGRGGMGIVYKARQTKLDRLVALKMVLTGAHSSEKDRKRFLSEARAVAQLRHQNILQIYEVGELKGLPYFSLEFLEGGTLQEKLEKYAMPPRDAAQLIETLARAVHYAHEKRSEERRVGKECRSRWSPYH